MKATLGLFLGVLFTVSVTACGDDGSGGSGGTGGTGGAGAEGGGGSGAQGGGGSGAQGGGGDGGGVGGGPAVTCDTYCADVMSNCTGDNAQFGDDTACKAVCATYAAGAAGAMDGASLACRAYHGGAPATSAPGTHCPHAGPLGGGICGTVECDNFCTIVDAICGKQATPPYASKDACMTACADFPGTGAVPYNAGAVAGDSLACRMYHLTVASTSAAMAGVHCPHTVADSPTCK